MLFGAHVSAAGGAHRAVERAAAIGCDAVQLFTQSPRMWRSRTPTPEDARRFRDAMDEHGVRAAVAHAPYIINLGAKDPELLEKGTTALRAGMEAAGILGLDAVVVHVGSHRGQGLDAVLDQVAAAIHHALEAEGDSWLLLENSAGAGDTIGRTVDELALVVEAAGAPERLGICLDTCHWWVSGVDVTDPGLLGAELDRLDRTIGLERLRAVHVNDALTDFGSHRDRHANLGEGTIGDGLASFLRHPAISDLPALLEVPGDGDGPTADQVAALRRLAGSD